MQQIGPPPAVASSAIMSDGVARAALFAAAFAGMALEIVAARRYAPAIGSGIDAWAAVIATALGGFALGHVLSGRLMSTGRESQRIVSSGLLAIATIVSAETASVPLLLLGPDGMRLGLGYPLMILFLGGACIATGMVGPAAARIVIERPGGQGGRIAAVFTLGAVGSIAGTLSAGFFLVPWLGLTVGPLIVALLAVAVCVAARRWRVAVFGMAMIGSGLVVAAFGQPRLCEVVTPFQCLSSVVVPEGAAQVRWLVADGTRQSTIPDGLNGPFSPYIAEALEQTLATVSKVARPRILEIGGAGMAYSTTIARAQPFSDVLTAEIDDGVTAFARRLGMRQSSNHRVEEVDGRVLLEEPGPPFDAVLVDAFRARFVPAQMATLQFFVALKRRLNPSGFVMINMIDGGDLRLAKAVAATASSVFSDVALWRRLDPGKLDNVVILINAPHEPRFFPVPVRWTDADLVLTDDRAPVELLAP